MTDFKKINGDELENFEYLYAHNISFTVEANYNKFNFHNLPTIERYRIERYGKSFDYEAKNLKRSKKAAETNYMDGMYRDYNYVDYLECIAYEDAVLNVMEEIQHNKNLYSNPSKIYRMKDGSLHISYASAEFNFTIDKAKKDIIKMMKDNIFEADNVITKLKKQVEEQKKLWQETFESYPEYIL